MPHWTIVQGVGWILVADVDLGPAERGEMSAAEVNALIDQDLKKKPPTPRCPGHGRHWYTNYGTVGDYQPKCVRCGFPNPRAETLG